MSTFYDPGLWKDAAAYKTWKKAAAHFGMDNPFEVKCLYVIGLARHIMYAANKLYPGNPDDADHSLPGCILAFNILELLGRCLRGDTEHYDDHDKRIKRGLRYIAGLSDAETKTLYVKKDIQYHIPNKVLVKIRNFTAHGFYGSEEKLVIDRLLVAWLFGAIGDAMQRYYDELRVGKNAEKMIEAAIQPLYDDGKPTRIEPIKKDIEAGISPFRPSNVIWNWSNDYTQVKQYQAKLNR